MIVYYVLATLSILLFLHGFFPIPARPSQTWPPNNVTSSHPKYQRAIIVIIDALRLDFVTDSKTPFLAHQYKESGCFIQLKVETPTVTLPRIKALTTGNVPQFVDIILNLASPTKVEDSFIHRAHSNGKKIVFYGDDIWVKLFPEQFMRSEGTSSFFVNDFTEVDDNVTRNVKAENGKKDWNIMILHYLGLDHIGHVYGPKSPLISPKLEEMDAIISEMYNANRDTLFVITGDHGMRDSGGHGGSTYPETNVPLIILGMSCKNDSFPQIDIPANLAILLGFDIPATSIGQLQDSLLQILPKDKYLQALKYNALLLRSKLDLCEENMETANHFLELFLLNGNEDLGESAAKLYKSCTRQISEKLLKSSIRQNLYSLIIGSLIVIVVLLKISQHLFGVLKKSKIEQFVLLGILLVQFLGVNSYFSPILTILTLFYAFQNSILFTFKELQTIDTSFLTILSFIHPLIFLSSSFLEEEHQFWYFCTNTFIFINIVSDKNQKIEWLCLFIAIRFIRTMNQVGDKWASSPDLADWLLQPENYTFLQIIFIIGLLLTCYSNLLFAKTKLSICLDAFIFVLICTFRTVVKEHVIVGQILWLLILFKFLTSYLTREGFESTWITVIALLLKPYNVILIPVCIFASHVSRNLPKNDQMLFHWWLGNLLFFAQGHDNSLASVDISAGYIGLREYEPLFVFPQVLCHTYALPVLSHLLLFRKLNANESLPIFVLHRLYVVLIVFLVTFIHRHHLFVWSVFAPKMFVEASHFAFLFIEVCCYYVTELIKKFRFW